MAPFQEEELTKVYRRVIEVFERPGVFATSVSSI